MPRAIREPRATRAAGTGRGAFTLVELLVVLVLVMLLSALTLAGLATARRGAKIDRTRNTIRRIHEIVMPQYENYLRRRVPFTLTTSATTNALNRLVAIRQLMVYEMPDSWNDVGNGVAAATTLPTFVRTGPVLGYAATKAALAAAPVGDTYGGAECLYMIASRGSGDADAMERFRTEEVGDIDGDGAPEFLDAWGRPIEFMRWAPGFAGSPVQRVDAANYHDPCDPLRVDPAGFALVPLVVSGGGDGVLGLAGPPATGWSTLVGAPGLASIVTAVTPQPGTATDLTAAADNITNHDLSKK